MPRRRPPPPTCIAPGCRDQPFGRRPMCRPHWFGLPPSLRFAIVNNGDDRGNYLANLRQAGRVLGGLSK